MYSHLDLANTILNRSFAQPSPTINTAQLQRILYLCDVEYRQRTGKPLVSAKWATFNYGPALWSLHHKMACLGGRPVTAFLRDAAGQAHMINGSIFDACLDKLFNLLNGLSVAQLATITRYPGGAWDTAYQNNEPMLNDHLVSVDSGYRRAFYQLID